MDDKISALCKASNVTYTRYADDLYFSCTEKEILPKLPSEIKKIIRQLDHPTGLWLNLDKTIHSSKKRSMKITGLILTNSGSISIGREKKREIRSLAYNWEKLDSKQKSHLSGYLAYCSSVEPSFINSLCKKYGAALISEIVKYTPNI